MSNSSHMHNVCVCVCVFKGIEAAARKQGRHKLRVWLKICSNGLKIVNERTGLVVQGHDRSKISSLTKDESDPRALAYIYQHEDSYVLFYFKMANLAYPVLLDIKEVCQRVDQVTPQEPAEPQNMSLVLLHDSSASPAQVAALKDASPQPDPLPGLSNQTSSRNELMELFLPQQEEPPSTIQSSCAYQPETPQQTVSAAQILSMFPTHPIGGSPYSFPAHLPTSMPLGQQGLLENQWGGQWPMTGGMPAWAPPCVTVPPPGGQQAQSVVLPQTGFVVGGSPGGSPATPPYMNGYPIPLNSAYPPTANTGAPRSPSLDNQSLL
ncbi:disabled homolog 2-like [Melanotaenia boesemani]|uniref:disabled homolog 2-like n=1 Tax=Melanotaenia boesemani TaxID=1250792 RepID=UPI001C054665|nr:disabled homolog 2-like [Melanotaenia boesemani]